jgi:hypothetical protein
MKNDDGLVREVTRILEEADPTIIVIEARGQGVSPGSPGHLTADIAKKIDERVSSSVHTDKPREK